MESCHKPQLKWPSQNALWSAILSLVPFSLLQEVLLTTCLSYWPSLFFFVVVDFHCPSCIGRCLCSVYPKNISFKKMFSFKIHLKDNGLCLKRPVYLNGLFFSFFFYDAYQPRQRAHPAVVFSKSMRTFHLKKKKNRKKKQKKKFYLSKSSYAVAS